MKHSVPKLRNIGPLVKPLEQRTVVPPPKRADPYYLSPEHRQWRAAVLKRAGYCCQGPGPHSGPLHAHHLVEIKDGGAKLDPRNGKALCAACHNREHPERGGTQ